jgi:hypothetical protein
MIATSWSTRHGEHWGPAADYVQAHLQRWTAALFE